MKGQPFFFRITGMIQDREDFLSRISRINTKKKYETLIKNNSG
jgi:hypothetical protein